MRTHLSDLNSQFHPSIQNAKKIIAQTASAYSNSSIKAGLIICDSIANSITSFANTVLKMPENSYELIYKMSILNNISGALANYLDVTLFDTSFEMNINLLAVTSIAALIVSANRTSEVAAKLYTKDHSFHPMNTSHTSEKDQETIFKTVTNIALNVIATALHLPSLKLLGASLDIQEMIKDKN